MEIDTDKYDKYDNIMNSKRLNEDNYEFISKEILRIQNNKVNSNDKFLININPEKSIPKYMPLKGFYWVVPKDITTNQNIFSFESFESFQKEHWRKSSEAKTTYENLSLYRCSGGEGRVMNIYFLSNSSPKSYMIHAYIARQRNQSASASSIDEDSENSGSSSCHIEVSENFKFDENDSIQQFENLEVKGTVVASNYLKLSDSREKINISLLEPTALDKMEEIRAYRYQYTHEPNSSPQIGFLAQEVQKIYPGLVHTIGNGDVLGINTDGLIALLWEEVRRLRNVISGSEKEAKNISQNNVDITTQSLNQLNIKSDSKSQLFPDVSKKWSESFVKIDESKVLLHLLILSDEVKQFSIQDKITMRWKCFPASKCIKKPFGAKFLEVNMEFLDWDKLYPKKSEVVEYIKEYILIKLLESGMLQ